MLRRRWTRWQIGLPLLAGIAVVAAAVGDPGEGSETGSGLAPSWEELANFTFEGVYPRPVRLTDGRWEGDPFVPDGASRPSLEIADPVLVTGDLDGDGSDEAVVLLMQASGASGLFHHLAVVSREGGALVQRGAAPLGDRVQIRAARVDGERVILEIVQAGPEDAMCCPTEMAELVWELLDRGLTQISSRLTGTLSIADLEGVEWVLERFSRQEPAPGDPEATLMVEGNRIAGSSFCNHYTGTVTGAAPGEIEIGPLAATRMSCPEPAAGLEIRFWQSLGAAHRFAFLNGKLALSIRRDGSLETLMFTPRAPAVGGAQR
jgi:heat shock protein HslJ